MTSPGPSPYVPVLMYHDLGAAGASPPVSHRPYRIGPPAFARQLSFLKSLGIVAGRLDEFLDGVAPRPRACVLTFDDGDASNYTQALPLLLEHGCRATFYLTTGWIGTPGYLTWPMVHALAREGMEIGSHSVSHRAPAGLSVAELRAEMSDSKRILEDHLGQPVLTASSPTGFYNPALLPVIAEAGYRALCFGRIGRWRPPIGAGAVPRIAIKSTTTEAEFLGIARGDGFLVARLRGRQMVRDAAKSVLGMERYLRFRRKMLSLLSPGP